VQKTLLALLCALLATAATARDTTHYLPIDTVLSALAASGKVDNKVNFFFGNQRHPEIQADFGRFVTNRKTNSFGKSDERACEWAMQSALIELYQRAIKEGGNAVVGVESFYKRQPYASVEDYECHAGAIIAGVALRGQVVRLEDAK
jgi:uncharacterized protein YbjQ (UPF0145 family)